MADPTITVQPPARKARKGGIRSVADFRTEDRLFVGALPVYDALPCSLAVEEVELCYVDITAEDKVAEGIDISQGVVPTFAGYIGVQCFVGPWDDYADRARDTLEQASDRLVEKALAVFLEGETEDDVPGGTLTEAIANLEAHADLVYIGEPVIVLSRGNAVRAAAEFALFPSSNNDGRLFTANGTPVLASSSVIDTEVYVAGALTVLASNIAVSQGYDITHNINMAIAEQAWNILIDCDFVAAANLTTP